MALTVWLAFIITVHVPVPLQPPPDQPENTEPEFGTAVRVTMVSVAYGSVQSRPQLIPAGLDVTVPDPAPEVVTVKVQGRCYCLGSGPGQSHLS